MAYQKPEMRFISDTLVKMWSLRHVEKRDGSGRNLLDLQVGRSTLRPMHGETARGRGGPWLRLTLAIAIAYFSQVHPYVGHLHAHDDHNHQMDRVNDLTPADRLRTGHHPGHDHDNDSLLWLADRVRLRLEFQNLVDPPRDVCLEPDTPDANASTPDLAGVTHTAVTLPEAIPIADLESRGPPPSRV